VFVIARRLPFLILTLAAVWAPAGASAAKAPLAEPPLGPSLAAVPGCQIHTPNRPQAATWAEVRYAEPVRILGILDKGQSAAALQRIARRLRAVLELRYLCRGGDEIYHVNDKWIEPKDNPTRDELREYAEEVVLDSLRDAARSKAFDVVFLDAGADNDRVQAAALECARAGALLIVTGHVEPGAGDPLAEVWPARTTSQRTWHGRGAEPGPHPAIAGVPVGRLRGHRWMPLIEPAEGAQALARGESGAAMLRDVGRGKLLYVPSGPLSRSYAAIEEFGRTFDHDEVWLRFWDQAIYELVRGDRALPALVRLEVPSEPAPAGRAAPIAAAVENRSLSGPLRASVHVTKPSGEVVFRRELDLDVPLGQTRTWKVEVETGEGWCSGLYPVYVTLGDGERQMQLHQALDWLAIESPIAMTVTTDRRGYRIGQEAHIKVTASAKRPWDGDLALGIYDFRGRLLHVALKDATLSDQPQEVEFRWPVQDHGTAVDVYWVQVEARQGGAVHQQAETRFYRYEPWSTRNEYQWSTWSGIACGAPCTVPAGMRLMAHAGMNALGYPGRSEIFYPAERWGWRYYNENIGVNTFSPVIEYENDAEIEAAVREQATRARDRRDLYSAAFVLGSVGEEAGFKHGWGTRYYWDTPVAPENACRAFQWFLREKYPTLDALNRTWGTNYSDWADVKLTRELSPGHGGKLVDFDADGWAHPHETPLGEGVQRIGYAPVADTAEFYNWYYDRIIVAAKRLFRDEINPVTRVMASAPTIGTPAVYDVRPAGPSAWNESQWHALNDGQEPGFGLIWGHFDWDVKTDNMFWGFLLTRSGHNNYWVDVPLMFNSDMTHTRASFAMRRWTARLAGHERVILDSRPAPSDVAVLPPNGLYQDKTRDYTAMSIRVAASQAGFGLPLEEAADLDKVKIVFAVARQQVSQQEADRLQQFVERGGTLVLLPCFSRETAARWGLKLSGRQISRHHDRQQVRFPLGQRLDGALDGFHVASWLAFRESADASREWKELAAYHDGTRAILARKLGRGRLLYVNSVYNSHQYIQWVTPTDGDRQGFFKLIESLCTSAQAQRTLRLDGPLDQALHVAVKEFTDPTGHIRYAIARTSGEVPPVDVTLHWLDRHDAAYDVLGGMRYGREVPLPLSPGEGRLLAFVRRPIDKIRLEISPAAITPGDTVTIMPRILDVDGQPVEGAFLLELRFFADDQELAGLGRSFSARSGQSTPVRTALSDPPGRWEVRIVDGITGETGTAEIVAKPGTWPCTAPKFAAWGWPSEVEEPARVSSQEFLSRLGRLRDIYLMPHADRPWLTKQRLGYYYEFFPSTRHALLRPLLDVDWREHSRAIEDAVAKGATFVLTGEDLGISPRDRLATYPHFDAQQIEALVSALRRASWHIATADEQTLLARLGEGRFILCRESVDAAGHDNPSVAGWQTRWLADLDAGKDRLRPIPAPNAERLRRWWISEQAIVDQPEDSSKRSPE